MSAVVLAPPGAQIIDPNIPPNGGKKRGRPAKALSLPHIARAHGVSVRMLERAFFVRRYGVPELHALVERGELKLGPAQDVARWPHEDQREACARGAEYVRQLIPLVRLAEREENGRQLAGKKHRAACPHCGGAL